MDDKQAEKMDQLIRRLDSSGIHEYLRLSQNTGKILWLNFISGIAKGLGFTVGTALVLAVVYKIVSRIISMNIPYITEWLQNLIIMVKGAAG